MGRLIHDLDDTLHGFKELDEATQELLEQMDEAGTDTSPLRTSHQFYAGVTNGYTMAELFEDEQE